MADDAELLRRYARTREEGAFAELVRRYLNLVYFAALRQVGGDAHRAEDVTQTVFALLARKASSLTRHQTLAGWLHTTTRFTASETLRAERRRLAREQEAHTMHELSTDSAAGHEWERLRPVIDDALGELSDPDREAVLLRFFANLPFAEVGTKLNLSENTARMRVERALEKLRALLARRGLTSTSAALGAVLADQAVAAAPAALATSVTSAVLAGAAAAGGSAAAAGSLGLMSTSKFISSLATLAVLLALAAGIYEVRAGRVARSALTAERREVFALALRVGEAERQAKEAVRRLALEQHVPAGAPNAQTAAAAEVEVRGPFGPEPPGSRARGRALMAAYPDIQQLVVRQKRAYFASRYKKLYRELGLTEAQVDAFEQIMISGVSSSFGALPGIGTVTLDAAPVLPEAEKDARLRQLLGERGFQRLEEFQRSQDGRVAMLASSLYFTDTPLTAEQGVQLQRVLVECNRVGRDRHPADFWAAVHAQAGAFLSEPQLVALRGLQAGDEFNFARAQNQRLRTAAEPTRSK